MNKTAQLYGFPCPLSAVTEQIYLSASSNGTGRQDDAGIVRAYLPVESPSLVSHLTTAQQPDDVASKTSLVLNLLEGIHLAATVEALALANKCGLDVKYVYEIISNAAGTSRVFENRGPGIVDGSLTSPVSLSQAIGSLVSVGDCVDDEYNWTDNAYRPQPSTGPRLSKPQSTLQVSLCRLFNLLH